MKQTAAGLDSTSHCRSPYPTCFISHQRNKQAAGDHIHKIEISPKKQQKEGDTYDDIIDVHQKALDDLVNVNSLFTIAVFVGLSFASVNQKSLENRTECDADPILGKTLVLYEVVSFASFLLSSLAAKSLKVLLNMKKIKRRIKRIPKVDRFFKDLLLSEFWSRTLLALSIIASFVGVVLLTLSMINVIQITIGKLSCGSDYSLDAVVSLSVIVLTALLLYAPSMLYVVIATAPRD